MRIAILLLIALASLGVAASAPPPALLWPAIPPPASVAVVLVHAPGEPWDEARAAAAVAAVGEALAWWAARLGAPPPSVGPVTAMAVAEPYAPATWRPLEGPGAVYVVARDAAGPLLPGERSGRARPGVVVALETPALGPLAALVAHEWGHAAHGLPDLPGGAADIMAGGYRTAYAEGRVGCASLALLGRPCWRVSLPGVAR